MKPDLVDILRCPTCQGELRLQQTDNAHGQEIEYGQLKCKKCESNYAISRGIPRLLPQDEGKNDSPPPQFARGTQRTAATFGYEFSHFEPPSREENRLIFFRKTGIDPNIYYSLRNFSTGDTPSLANVDYLANGSFLKDKLVLDLGCGMGRFLGVASEYAGEVVGLDISSAIDTARQLYGNLTNVHFVQGDILAPPLRQGIYDFVYSIGVLHHTKCTFSAFRSATSLTKKGGHLAVWVYPPEYWNDLIRGSIAKALRVITRRLSPRLLHGFCLLLYPLGKLQNKLGKRKLTKILGSPAFLVPVPRDQLRDNVDLGVIYDYYSPHYIWTHTNEEVFDWFVKNGFKDIRILPIPTAVLGRKSN